MGSSTFLTTILTVMFLMSCSADSLQVFEGSTFSITGFSNCVNEPLGKDVIPRHIKLTKYNRTHHHLYSNFTLPFDFDDNITVHVDVKRKSVSGSVNVMKISSQLCNLVNRYFKNTLRKLFESGGYNVESCPMPKGTYQWNSVLDMKIKNLPYVPFGEYESTAVLYRGVRRKKVMCITVFISIKPKISNNKDDTIFKIEK